MRSVLHEHLRWDAPLSSVQLLEWLLTRKPSTDLCHHELPRITTMTGTTNCSVWLLSKDTPCKMLSSCRAQSTFLESGWIWFCSSSSSALGLLEALEGTRLVVFYPLNQLWGRFAKAVMSQSIHFLTVSKNRYITSSRHLDTLVRKIKLDLNF